MCDLWKILGISISCQNYFTYHILFDFQALIKFPNLHLSNVLCHTNTHFCETFFPQTYVLQEILFYVIPHISLTIYPCKTWIKKKTHFFPKHSLPFSDRLHGGVTCSLPSLNTSSYPPVGWLLAQWRAGCHRSPLLLRHGLSDWYHSLRVSRRCDRLASHQWEMRRQGRFLTLNLCRWFSGNADTSALKPPSNVQKGTEGIFIY